MKTFYKYILFFLLLSQLLYLSAAAQSFSSFSQYYQMPYLVNPAITGIQGFTDVKVGTRQQWTSFEQAPKSYFLGMNHTIGDYNLFSKGNGDAVSQATQVSRSPGMTRIGISGYINQTNFQAFNNLDAGLSYAIHLPVSEQFNLSFGLSTFISRTKADMNQFMVRDTDDQFYKNLIAANGALQYFNLDAGLFLYSARFFAGYSAIQLTKSRLTKIEGSDYQNAILHSGMIGYNFIVNEGLEVIPTVIVQTSGKEGNGNISLNLKARYRSKFWGGVGFSPNKSMTALIGFAPNGLLNINYSYDINLGAIQGYSSSSHEIVLGFALFNKDNRKLFLW